MFHQERTEDRSGIDPQMNGKCNVPENGSKPKLERETPMIVMIVMKGEEQYGQKSSETFNALSFFFLAEIQHQPNKTQKLKWTKITEKH